MSNEASNFWISLILANRFQIPNHSYHIFDPFGYSLTFSYILTNDDDHSCVVALMWTYFHVHDSRTNVLDHRLVHFSCIDFRLFAI